MLSWFLWKREPTCHSECRVSAVPLNYMNAGRGRHDVTLTALLQPTNSGRSSGTPSFLRVLRSSSKLLMRSVVL